MSTQSNKGKAKRSADYEPKFEFINYTLTKRDTEWLDKADCEEEIPFSRSLDLAAEGYKFSLARDDKHSCYVASITDRDTSSAFFNKCLTGRGATAIDAWYGLAYRHFIYAQGDWSVFPLRHSGAPQSKYW